MNMLTRFCKFGMVLLLAIIGIATITTGQTGTATLSGIVTDEAGAVVPNCEIQLQSVARRNVITTKINNEGIYVFERQNDFGGTLGGPFRAVLSCLGSPCFGALLVHSGVQMG